MVIFIDLILLKEGKMKITRRDFLRIAAAGSAILKVGDINFADSSKPNRLNLLFLMTDQQRFDALSCAGNKVLHTPNLDRLASEGVRFSNAYTNCPMCVPARAVILTGHSTNTLGIRCNGDYDKEDVPKVKTFDNILSSLGYATEYYGKWHTVDEFSRTYRNYVKKTGKHTPEGKLSQRDAYLRWLELDKQFPERPPGRGELRDNYSMRSYKPDRADWRFKMSPGEAANNYHQAGSYGWLQMPSDCTRTAFTAEEVCRALNHLSARNRPFSLTCSFGPPHPPTILPRPYYGRYSPSQCNPPASIHDPMEGSPYAKKAALEEMQRYKNPEILRYVISDYYGLVKEVDDWVGRILYRLEYFGLFNNTLVVFTSDHGEMLGDHGMYSKFIFYEGSVHIPLIMRLPGVIPAGIVVDNPVSHIDIFPTLLDYLGVRGHKSEGRNLRHLIDGFYPASDFCVSSSLGNSTPNYMVRSGDWKLMIGDSPKSRAVDALYNLKEDPDEMNNLIWENKPISKRDVEVAEDLKARLVSWLESIDSPDAEGVRKREISQPKPRRT